MYKEQRSKALDLAALATEFVEGGGTVTVCPTRDATVKESKPPSRWPRQKPTAEAN